MSITMPELVVLDLAGTTVKDNRDVHRVLQQSMKEFGFEITLEEANEVMGIPKPVAIRHLLNLRHGDSSESLVNQIHERFVSSMISFYRDSQEVGGCSGIEEAFSILKSNHIHIALDTGFDRLIASALLERLGWLKVGLVDVLITSDDVHHGRPHPDMILAAMHLVRVHNPAKVAKVGDTLSDLEEGHAAGCQWVIGVTTGAFSREQLLTGKPTHLVEFASDIIHVFKLASRQDKQVRR